MSITIALPSKGSLYDGTLKLFGQCGMPIKRDGRGRGYWGSIKNVPNIRVQFLRAEEIPLRVDAGDVQIGVTGLDLYREYCGDSKESYALIQSLEFGYARLVVAVPNIWIDVTDMEDLAEIASRLKQQKGRGLRVGTKFHRLTRELFAQHHIRDYVIVDSRGATEGMPAAGSADIVVDLTSSGATLIENDLKEIGEGTAIESEACLLVNQDPVHWSSANFETVTQIAESLEAGLFAKRRSLIHFSVASERMEEISQTLEIKFDCESQPDGKLFTKDSQPVWAGVICPTSKSYRAVHYLRSSGATGISVVNPDLVYGATSASVEAFESLLKKKR